MAVDGHIAQLAAVVFDELFRLHKHKRLEIEDNKAERQAEPKSRKYELKVLFAMLLLGVQPEAHIKMTCPTHSIAKSNHQLEVDLDLLLMYHFVYQCILFCLCCLLVVIHCTHFPDVFAVFFLYVINH